MQKVLIGNLKPPIASATVAGVVMKGEDVAIASDGKMTIDTNYDTVDVNVDTNISNIVKGGKFKTILGNIRSALLGLNSKFTLLDSNLAMKITSGNLSDIIGALPAGKYAGYYGSGATGTPSSYGTFEAIVMNNTTATITVINTSNGVSYSRVKTSNTWKDWERDITSADLSYQVGETVKASICTAGFITSAGTEVFFSVPINKPIATDKATISIAGISIRQNNRYLLQNTLGSAKIAVHSMTQNNVVIKITFPSAPDGVINNDAVGIELSGAYLTVIS